MSNVEEYIGRRSIEAVNYDGQGNNLYNIWLVMDEPIVRCRDCKEMVDDIDGYQCQRSSGEYFFTAPDNFCKWGVRRNEL